MLAHVPIPYLMMNNPEPSGKAIFKPAMTVFSTPSLFLYCCTVKVALLLGLKQAAFCTRDSSTLYVLPPKANWRNVPYLPDIGADSVAITTSCDSVLISEAEAEEEEVLSEDNKLIICDLERERSFDTLFLWRGTFSPSH